MGTVLGTQPMSESVTPECIRPECEARGYSILSTEYCGVELDRDWRNNVWASAGQAGRFWLCFYSVSQLLVLCTITIGTQSKTQRVTRPLLFEVSSPLFYALSSLHLKSSYFLKTRFPFFLFVLNSVNSPYLYAP